MTKEDFDLLDWYVVNREWIARAIYKYQSAEAGQDYYEKCRLLSDLRDRLAVSAKAPTPPLS